MDEEMRFEENNWCEEMKFDKNYWCDESLRGARGFA
jgi:hypothetical protein